VPVSDTRTLRDQLDRILTIIARAARFWVWAGLVVVLGTGAALVFAVTRPRVYQSETLILYRQGIRSSDLGGPDAEGGDPARKLGLKLKEMVLSRTSLEKIVDEMKLYPKIVDDRGLVDAVDEMRKHIAFRVKDGDTFGLSFEGENAERVQLVTARLAQTLLSENTRSNEHQAEVTKQFLDAEQERADTELKEKETNLAKFLAKHPEFAKETASNAGGAGTAIRATQAAQEAKKAKPTDATLLALEREASRIQERLGMPTTLKRKSAPEIDPKLLAEKQAAEADVQAAQKDVAEKLAQFTEQHPDTRAAKVRLKIAQERLRHVSDAIAQQSASQLAKQQAENADEGTIDRAALERELTKVNGDIAAYKSKKRREDDGPTAGSSGWIVALETEWTRLNREVAEARERNQQLQDKQFRASMQESAASSGHDAQMVIVDPAYRPTHPAKTSRSVIAAAGLAVSIVFAIGLALGCALLDDRLYDRVDVERLALGPLLGVVPRAPRKQRKRGDLG
jgi:uncharacterized protein involved in exopolysaccharide biosynthesis